MMRIFVLLIFLLSFYCTFGQQYIIDRFTSENFNTNISIYKMDRDSTGFLWLGTNIGLFRFDGKYFERYENAGNEVVNVQIDQENQIWVASNLGIIKIASERNVFEVISGSKELGQIHELQIDKDNNILFYAEEGGFHYLRSGEISRYESLEFKRDTIPNESIESFKLDQNDHLWILYRTFLFHYDESGKLVTEYEFPRGYTSFDISDDLQYVSLEHMNLWKTIKINLQSGEKSEEVITTNLSAQGIRSHVFIDSKNRALHSHYGGLVIQDLTTDTFEDISGLFKREAFPHTIINQVYEMTPTTFYLATSTGLFKLKILPYPVKILSSKDIPFYDDNKFLSVRSILADEDQLYIGSYGPGYISYNLQSGESKQISVYSNNFENYINFVAYSLHKAPTGEILIGSETDGFIKYFPLEDTASFYLPGLDTLFEESNEIPIRIFSLVDDGKRFFLGSNAGLFQFENNTFSKIRSTNSAFNNALIYHLLKYENHIYAGTTAGLFEVFQEDVVEIPVLSENDIIVNYLYPHGRDLWIGTRGDGLIKYNLTDQTYRVFGYEAGMIDLTVNGIVLGIDSALWFSTNYGISRLNHQNESITHFFIENELGWTEFNHNAVASSSDGTLFFGGVGGIACFNPGEFIVEELPAELIFCKVIQRDGKTELIVNNTFGFTKHSRIELKPNDQYFAVTFGKSNLNYSQGDQYNYRIDGEKWISNGNSTTLTFTGLKAGKHLLEIGGQDEMGRVFSTISVPVHIQQVFYKQWWAWVFYFMAFFALGRWIFNMLLVRSQLQSNLAIEKAYTQKLQSLAETRTQVFSNLAHEFQTPLTLIQGPAYKISEVAEKENVQKWARTILQNTKALVDMIQQLLKLSRMDEGVYDLEWKEGDIISFLKGVTMSFQSLAEERGIDLNFKSNPDSLWCKYDEDKIQHIIKNLLSNALKFTNQGGGVKISIDTEIKPYDDMVMLNIEVSDNGSGISPENLPYIFERFYQEDSSKTRKAGGTGIGLSLVKEFINILNGQIKVRSTQGKGSEFTVSIPLELITPKDNADIIIGNGEPSAQLNKGISIPYWTFSNQTQVLLIEDNAQVRTFIKDCLAEDYLILEAEDGEEGYNKAIDTIPDLIIMDVMMPKKDGYTLAQELKSNNLTSHIPCIMLTAKSTDTARLEGRKAGVEVFLTKPFHPEELRLSADNLLKLKTNIEGRQGKTPQEEIIQDGFMIDLLAYLNIEMGNPDLNVEMITKKMAVSRTQLHRKIKSLSGKSINQFVREYRLEKARELILNGNENIAEICFEVGFSQPSYFAARFKEYFGVLPSEVR